MLVKPFLAIVTFADKSLMEFPSANIVTPMIVSGILKRTPRNFKREIRHSAIVSIHVAATIKPKIDIGTDTSKDKAPSVEGANRSNNKPKMKEKRNAISI